MDFLTTLKEQKGYTEEMVILDETKELLKYSLANNLDDIKIAIYARTGRKIDLPAQAGTNDYKNEILRK